jgi:hypothetical protein
VSDVLERMRAGEAEAAIEALARLQPPERRRLAPQIIALHRRWDKSDFGPLAGRPNTYGPIYRESTEEQREASRACVIAVATAAELLDGADMPRLVDPPEVLAIVGRVRPPWLEPESLEALCDARHLDWHTAESLVAAGHCARPTSERLIESLVAHQGFRFTPSLAGSLREWRGLFADGVLYRLFEVEGGQDSSLAAVDKFRRDTNQWITALVELCASGELDRARVLDLTLRALARDFAAFRAGWFTRFHDRLAPTDEERAARSEAYLRLLGSGIPGTVSFAVKAVEALVKRDLIPPDRLLAQLPPVLSARQKGTVATATRLMLAAVERMPAGAPSAIETAIAALAHPETEVQERLLDGIERMLPLAGPEESRLRARLAACHGVVAASLQSRLPASGQPVAPVRETPEARAPLDTDPLAPAHALAPAKTVEEALDVVAHALEHEDDPVAHERALDAIARHAGPVPGWAVLAGPLRKRAEALLRSQRRFEHVLQAALAHTVSVWTSGEAVEWVAPMDRIPADLAFVFQRLAGIASRLLARKSLPLLSTPTHRGGFIDPAAFQERLRVWQERREPLDPCDAVLALMRLPADRRQRAREQVSCEPAAAMDVGASAPVLDHSFRLISKRYKSYKPNEFFTRHEVEVTREPEVPPPVGVLELRRALLRGEVYGDVASTRWCATATPDDLGAHFASGVWHLGMHIDEQTRSVALEAARPPWVALGRPGHWLLMLGLSSRSAEVVSLAVDVAIDGIESGRVEVGALGAALAELMGADLFFKPKRAAGSLSQVAAVSERHAGVVRAVIARGLRGDPLKPPRDVGSLLSLLHELLVAARAHLDDPAARTWLEGQTQGGQVAKLRKAILAL